MIPVARSALLPRAMASRTVVAAAAAGHSAPLRPQSIWAVGKNYLEHIKELKSVLNMDPNDVPSEPLIFLKAGATLLPLAPDTVAATAPDVRELLVQEVEALPPTPLPLPTSWSKNVHHEVELAVELGSDLRPVRAAISIDMTARDVQNQLKAKGFPWTLSKSFIAATPVGQPFELHPPGQPPVNIQGLTLVLKVNGKKRQEGSTHDMIFPVGTLLEYCRERYPLSPGDLILTGTPEGVGQLVPGDRVVAWVGDGSTILSAGSWLCTGPKGELPAEAQRSSL